MTALALAPDTRTGYEPAAGVDRAIRVSTAIAVLAVAGVAAYVSYWHAYAVVCAHGETGVTARLEPATIDGLVYASSMVNLYAARHRLPVPALARWLLALGIVATLAANMAQGWSHGPVGAVIAACCQRLCGYGGVLLRRHPHDQQAPSPAAAETPRATPLLPATQGTSVIELGEPGSWGVTVGVPPAIVRVGAVDFAGAAKDQLSTDDIRPLLFGAAWKVLDQLCELGLEIAHVPHNAGWRYTIAFKVTEAASGRVAPLAPFAGRPDMWSRIMTTL